MRLVECEMECEVLDAVVQGRWPERVDAGMRAHVAACGICADVVTIAGTIDQAREEMREAVALPDSGRVWWVAQMRARREAAQTAGRPITAAQVIAFACAMGLLGACFGATSAWFQAALLRAAAALSTFKLHAALLLVSAFVSEHAILLLAIAGILLAVPAACLTALRE